VELVRLAVRSGLFPLFEVFEGKRYRINIEPDGTDPMDYFARQRRFREGELDAARIGQECQDRISRLRDLADRYPAEGVSRTA
jgi:pyruvate ferredoxin oxidoreductase beta subunit/2-oxoisovalerate ferredoxin oxidoreductase beta subunit